jgi:hypothetical protein
MGELVVNMFMSLDGVLQGPGAPDEDREEGFEYGGWQAPYLDEESGKVITDHIAGLRRCCSAAGPMRSSRPTGPSSRPRTRSRPG